MKKVVFVWILTCLIWSTVWIFLKLGVRDVHLGLLGSVVAAWLNYWLLPRVGAVNLLIRGLVEPPIAVLLGAWMLGESMNARAAAGSAMILLSVRLATRRSSR